MLDPKGHATVRQEGEALRIQSHLHDDGPQCLTRLRNKILISEQRVRSSEPALQELGSEVTRGPVEAARHQVATRGPIGPDPVPGKGHSSKIANDVQKVEIDIVVETYECGSSGRFRSVHQQLCSGNLGRFHNYLGR
jgi:hypothetical protein